MSEIKLKPCPFCGGKPYTYTAITIESGKKRVCWVVHCKQCHLNYPAFKKCYAEEGAIEAWNRRDGAE